MIENSEKELKLVEKQIEAFYANHKEEVELLKSIPRNRSIFNRLFFTRSLPSNP